MKVKAAVLFAPHQPFEILDLDLREPGPGEVLVKIAAAGVCHSDYHLVSGATKHPMPVVAGHEGAGMVEAIGTGVKDIAVGDSVILSWTPDCGRCFYCLRGKPNLCETYTAPIWAGVMLDGTTRLSLRGKPVYHYCGLASFATHAVVPQESCVKASNEVPMGVAALVGCAVATGVGAAIYTSPVRPGDSVVVYGAGGVGLSIIQGARLSGAKTIIAVDRTPAKMEIARKLGATHSILSDQHTIENVRASTDGRGADHVFEAVGLASLQEAALEAVRPGGTLVLAGLSPMGTPTNLPGAILTRKEITVKGSYYGSVHPRRDFPMLLDLYQAGRLDLDSLISRTFSLEQINEAYQKMLAGHLARGVITF